MGEWEVGHGVSPVWYFTTVVGACWYSGAFMLLRLWAKYVLFLGISLCETPASQHVFAYGEIHVASRYFASRNTCQPTCFRLWAKYVLLLGISLCETPASQHVFAYGEIHVVSLQRA
jgi:hypothetical protein